MHHPGPPQFVAVGDRLQVAPRDPDPEATYRWRVREAPLGSDAALGPAPVETFVADKPGRYTLELVAPDGTHRLTVRAFPEHRAPTDESGQSGGVAISDADHEDGYAESADPGGGGRPRVRLSGRVEGDEVVVHADARPHPEDLRSPADLGVEFLLDDRDDLDRGDVTVGGHDLRVPLSAVPDRARVHAVSVAESRSVADALAIERLGGGDGEGGDGGGEDDVAFTHCYDPPEWALDRTVYEVYVRGFADPGEGESVFDAIRARLDHVADLGADLLWLTPVLENDDAPHGYNITDFHGIAADLGDREDYERLVEAAHDRGMRVLFDLVLNHSARQHPYFEDAYRNPDSEYYEWYEWQDSGEPGTYFDWEKIANFDFTHLPVRRHLLDAVDTWAEVADGFRCDMAWAVPRNVWQEVRDRVKARDPEFLMLDETIPYVADFHEGMFDVHFDTTLYFALRQVGNGHGPPEALLDAVEQRTETGFPDHAGFMQYLENHDETRYVVECGDAAALAAAGAITTLPGIPMLYAGQELGQRGRRDTIAWDHAREEFRDHYERLLALRRERPALGYRGDLSRLDYEADGRVVAYERSLDGDAYAVVLNFDERPATVELDVAVEPTDLVTGTDAATVGGLVVDDVAVFRRR